MNENRNPENEFDTEVNSSQEPIVINDEVGMDSPSPVEIKEEITVEPREENHEERVVSDTVTIKEELPITNTDNSSQVARVVEEPVEKPKKKKRRVFVKIINILAFLLLLFVIFETAIAFLNFQQVRENKEPSYFVKTRVEEKDGYKYTIHDMGLYRIIRKEDNKNFEIKMLPFFLDYTK